MSPERTNNVTSLPVRPERASRNDQAPASDVFATLLGAHADKADRAPARRERPPVDDRPRQRDDKTAPTRPADRRDPAKPAPKPTADRPADKCDPTAKPADEPVAATAANAALFGLITAVTPQQPATPALAPVEAAPAAEVAPVVPQAVPAVPQPAAETQVPATEVAKGAETAGIETGKTQAPEQGAVDTPLPAEVASVVEEQTPTAAPAPVPGSASTRTADRKSEGVSGAGAEARPSAGAPVNPATAQAQSNGAPSDQGGGQQSDQRQDTPAPRTMQPAAAPATASVTAPRVDVTPVAVNTPGAATPEPKGAATLSQAPRALGQLIHMASQNGVQHARLNLKPVELGGIEIRLQATSAGVTAHVVADSPEAARLLQQAGEDLKRSLASQNVELISLDVSTSGDDRRDASAAGSGFGQFDETGPRGDRPGRSQRSGGDEADSDLPTTQIQGTVLELPDGVLVDVLA